MCSSHRPELPPMDVKGVVIMIKIAHHKLLHLHLATNSATVEMKRSGISSIGMCPQSLKTSNSAPKRVASFWLFQHGTNASLLP